VPMTRRSSAIHRGLAPRNTDNLDALHTMARDTQNRRHTDHIESPTSLRNRGQEFAHCVP
jgi:hypothetical protein